MKTFNIRCFGTASVSARDENHAREILNKYAKGEDYRQITLWDCKGDVNGNVFALVTIDVRDDMPLELVDEY